jgi:hypothetical protein
MAFATYLAPLDFVRLSQPGDEQKANYAILLGMFRRPDPAEFDRPLNREELKEQRRRLSLLSPHHVAEEYRKVYETCKMEGDRLPRASSVQGLVTAWKLLWSWREQRPPGRS